MAKAKQKNGFQNNTIFHFPDRINDITVVLIIILYGFILGGILTLVLPKEKNHTIPDYSFGQFHEEINPILLVRAIPVEKEDQEKGKYIDVEYYFYAYIKATGTTKPTNVRFGYSGLDNEGNMKYFTEPSSVSGYSVPLSHYQIGYKLSNISGFDRFFMRTRYKMPGVEASKSFKLSESVLELKKKELGKSVFTNETSDLVEVVFKIEEKDDLQYKAFFTLEAKVEENYHINMQTWLVTENQEIYPFLGLYNYCSREKFNYNYESVINKNINPVYLYMKLEYQNEAGSITTLYYKESISAILQ